MNIMRSGSARPFGFKILLIPLLSIWVKGCIFNKKKLYISLRLKHADALQYFSFYVYVLSISRFSKKGNNSGSRVQGSTVKTVTEDFDSEANPDKIGINLEPLNRES